MEPAKTETTNNNTCKGVMLTTPFLIEIITKILPINNSPKASGCNFSAIT